MKATVEITIRMLLEADKTVDKKCIDRGIAALNLKKARAQSKRTF